MKIDTKCPACHSSTLDLGDDRRLVCTLIGCPDPTMIDRIGEAERKLSVVAPPARPKIAEEVACLAKERGELLETVQEMLATVRVNLLRGTLRTDDDAFLERLLEKWGSGLDTSTVSGHTLARWSKELPTSQGLWWWWCGDEDSAPIPVTIMYSGTSGTYFAAAGQWGWVSYQETSDMGGWWMPCVEPAAPSASEPASTFEKKHRRSPQVVCLTPEHLADLITTLEGLKYGECFCSAAGRTRDFQGQHSPACQKASAVIEWCKRASNDPS